MVYPSSATFYASYSVPRRLGIQVRRCGRIAVGVFGLHTIAQARAAFQDVRRKAFSGIDPKAVKAQLTYAEFHVHHYQVQCIWITGSVIQDRQSRLFELLFACHCARSNHRGLEQGWHDVWSQTLLPCGNAKKLTFVFKCSDFMFVCGKNLCRFSETPSN